MRPKEKIKSTICYLSPTRRDKGLLLNDGLSVNDYFNYILIVSSKLAGDKLLDLSWYYRYSLIIIVQELDRSP